MKDTLTPLGNLPIGSKGTIQKFGRDDERIAGFDMAERLRELGFIEGLTFEVLHQAPFGQDPMAVRVGNMTVALRRRDANIILVETE